MKATQMLHNLGQSIWLDNITRELLDSGTLEHYINDLSVTASDVFYIGALAAPNTVNTMPEETLLAFGEHGRTNGVIPRRVADCEQVLTEFGRVGIDVAKLGADLQAEDAKSFDDSW
jgi:transaldolase